MSALVSTACFGGQTGEITELTACREPVGTRSVDEAGTDAPSARAQLDAVATSLETELAWEDRTTTLFVGYALSGDPGTLLGGPECPQPWLELPVLVTVRTADGALDETIEGVAVISSTETVAVRGSIALSELRGSVDPTTLSSSVDPNGDTLEVELQSDREALAGRIAVRSGVESSSDRDLATF